MTYIKSNTTEQEFLVEDEFNKYLKDNWTELVEHAENMTGEQYDGLEPLLSKETIIEYAKELWENENKELIKQL